MHQKVLIFWQYSSLTTARALVHCFSKQQSSSVQNRESEKGKYLLSYKKHGQNDNFSCSSVLLHILNNLLYLAISMYMQRKWIFNAFIGCFMKIFLAHIDYTLKFH